MIKRAVLILLFLTVAGITARSERPSIRLVATIFEIHPAGIECLDLYHWSQERNIPGDHFIRFKTEGREIYHGQEITLYASPDGTITSDDGTLTLKAWKLDPTKPFTPSDP